MWNEFVVDNKKNVSLSGKRSDKAYIMNYCSDDLKFRITARHHDGEFKYYLDCEQAEVFEHWFAIHSEKMISVKRKAMDVLERKLHRNNLQAFIELSKVREGL